MEGQSKILATVGGIAITEQDLNEFMMSLGQRAAAYQNEQGREILLDQLIAQKLFLAEARRNMYELEPAFKSQLNELKAQLLTQYAMEKTLSSVKVTDEEAKKYFSEHPEEFAGEETVTASHILVDSEEKANDILNRIQSGDISFEDAAKQYSSCPSGKQGGSLGEFGRGQMVPEFETACFEMEEGELRGPVKTQFGFHLIRLDGKGKSEPLTYAQAQGEIKQSLLQEKQQKTYQSHINQLKILFPVDKASSIERPKFII